MTINLSFQIKELLLRPFALTDSTEIYRLSREPGIMQWIPDQVYDSEQNAIAVLKYLIKCYDDPGNPTKGPYVLGVCLKKSKKLIGHVGLNPLKDTVEIGYAIGQEFNGKGYATQAVTAMSLWGLKHFGLPEILGNVSYDNIASCRVLEKAGYVLIEEKYGQLHDRKGLVRTYRYASRS
jgi:ribosomal-protein-alanine N-acetyltransferase